MSFPSPSVIDVLDNNSDDVSVVIRSIIQQLTWLDTRLRESKESKEDKKTKEKEKEEKKTCQVTTSQSIWSTYQGDHMWRDKQSYYHREHDEPAIVRANGDKEWWHHGKRHRDPSNDLPAVISLQNKRQEWWVDGIRHRDTFDQDGHLNPAALVDGEKFWYINGDQVKAIIKAKLENKEKARREQEKVADIANGFLAKEEEQSMYGPWNHPVHGRRVQINVENGSQLWVDSEGNKVHRDSQLRIHCDAPCPAIRRPDGTLEWWQHGKRHRNDGLPAIEKPNGENEWYEQDVLVKKLVLNHLE